MPARPLAAALLALLAAASATAQPSADPQVAVTLAADGEATLIHATVEIDAPPGAVWRVIYDCAYALKLMKKLKRCEVLERDPKGRWDVREHVIQPLIFPEVRTVMRAEYDPPRRVEFTQLEGDVKGQAGRWRLEPMAGGAATRLTYDNRVELGLPIAGPIFRQALRAETPEGMARLRAAAEALNP